MTIAGVSVSGLTPHPKSHAGTIDFLVNGSRYRDLSNYDATDYKGWAHGLKKASYATDPKYPEFSLT